MRACLPRRRRCRSPTEKNCTSKPPFPATLVRKGCFAMKKKTRVLIISYTAALVAALAVGLIACRTDANRRQTAMDANYRHAYGEVLNAVQELDSSLQKSLYATTAAMECTVCTDIYSNAQTAEMALGVLPVNSHALERIARNIALAGDYARTLSRNAAEGRTFTSEELEHLRAFSDATKQLSTQLAALGQSLYDGAVTTTAHVRSTESLENLGSEADLSDTLEAELAALADSFEELPLPIADGSYQVRTAADYAMLAGHDEVTEEQAQAAAAAFLDLDAARLQATGRSEGAVPCWNFDIDGGDDTSYIAVTVSGGEVLRYYSSCAGGEPVLSTDEAAEAAAAFLRARGYDGMRLIDTEDAGQSLICTFCYVQDGVLCTADQLRVRVRLDDGTVCGFSSASYLDTHRARTLSADTIGAEAGQAAVPGALQVVDTRTAFLRLYGARETLCYEYLCETDDGQRCVIAVNARTGQQERIQTSDVSGGVQMQF
nr:MAG TPA: YpeB [Caudoviricetes sp.]